MPTVQQTTSAKKVEKHYTVFVTPFPEVSRHGSKFSVYFRLCYHRLHQWLCPNSVNTMFLKICVILKYFCMIVVLKLFSFEMLKG